MSKNLTKKLVFSAMAIALGIVASRFKLFAMPTGGAITPFSMLFVSLVGYWFGLKYGLIAGVAYGLLRFLISDSGMVSVPQALLDYPLAFGALGLSGIFKDKKWGLQIGLVVGIFGRFFFHLLSGVLFFAAYAPEGMNAWVYSATYNGTYLSVEAILSIVVISIPQVARALKQVKIMTGEE